MQMFFERICHLREFMKTEPTFSDFSKNLITDHSKLSCVIGGDQITDWCILS